jgi:branched-subunit amino acid transport protein
MMWPLVLTASVGCYLLKLAGHAVPPSVLGRPRVRRIAALLPVALLAALVAVQTFGSGQALVVDARLPGVAAAAIALVLRAPFLVVVVVAGVVAAGLRYTGLAA